jgi:hypothetical protein
MPKAKKASKSISASFLLEEKSDKYVLQIVGRGTSVLGKF